MKTGEVAFRKRKQLEQKPGGKIPRKQKLKGHVLRRQVILSS